MCKARFSTVLCTAFHGVGGDVEPLGSFFVAQAFRNQFNHLAQTPRPWRSFIPSVPTAPLSTDPIERRLSTSNYDRKAPLQLGLDFA
jgi:hypothetical protein